MLETARLCIHALTHSQLMKYIQADNSLEQELGLENVPRTISVALQEALTETLLPKVANPDNNYLYWTLWSMVLKEHNCLVGDLCLQGEPNEQGEIEVGYGTYEAFRGQGLMIEALAGLIGWLKTQEKVKAVVASTEKTNVASFTILQKNGFVKVSESEELYHWKLSLQGF